MDVGWVVGALNPAIKSERDRASVQDRRRQHCAQVQAFRRACFGSGELRLLSAADFPSLVSLPPLECG